MTFRKALYEQFTHTVGERVSPLNLWLVVLIIASILVVVLETSPRLSAEYGGWFEYLNLMFAMMFTSEYIGRVWSAGEDPRYQGMRGRLRYMLTPMALVDLIALLPFFLIYVSDAFLLRLLRLLRILALAKLARYTVALNMLGRAIYMKRYELTLTGVGAGIACFIAAVVMHLLESEVQPEAFGSIALSMWWSVVSLTTMGYGDTYPITDAGKAFAGFYSICTIGLIALPTGILTAAFMEEFHRPAVDQDGQYPTDGDYRTYEQAFIAGKQAKAQGLPPDCPYPRSHLGISSWSGWQEGYHFGESPRD